MAKFPIAVMTPFTDQTDPPGTVAAAAERYGFDMLCMGEHPFYPVRMNTPYPGGGETPRWYQRIADLFVVLAMAAQATSTIRLASSVCLVPERNPILLANAVASLDYFSGGRFSLGVGTGWVREEYEILGADFDHRWEVLREYVLAMKEMWTKPEADFAWPMGQLSGHPSLSQARAATPSAGHHLCRRKSEVQPQLALHGEYRRRLDAFVQFTR